jgi:hypothetical protein
MKLQTLSAALALLFIAGHAMADSKKEARVTQIVRDVKILPADAAARAAVVNDRVADNTGVRTGGDSRSELTFADLTITRLGSNTIFSFNKAGRNVQLDSGSILLRVPKNSGGGAIKTNAVTVAVTGTTVIFESTRSGQSKLIVLEGGASASLVKYRGKSQYVHAGQMLDVPAGATSLPLPTNVDLNQIMNSHPLITDFPPLPSRDLIVAASQQQPPPPSGPSTFPILPVISLLGGGVNVGPHGPHQNPPRHNPQPNNPKGTGNGNTRPPPTPPPVYTNGKTNVPSRNQSVPKPKPTPKRVIKKTNQSNNGPG